MTTSVTPSQDIYLPHGNANPRFFYRADESLHTYPKTISTDVKIFNFHVITNKRKKKAAWNTMTISICD